MVMATVLGASCIVNIDPGDNRQQCAPEGASQRCPSGYHCATDNKCWRNGTDPSPGVDGAQESGGDSHADLTVLDVASFDNPPADTPVDTAVPDSGIDAPDAGAPDTGKDTGIDLGTDTGVDLGKDIGIDLGADTGIRDAGNPDLGIGLGNPCSVTGAMACQGTAQKLKLICSNSEWQQNGTCSANENCDQSTGVCAPIVTGCSGRAAGYKFCDGLDVLRTCGPDLVSTTATTCAGVCQLGQCLTPRCGDGKPGTGEECDDGNDTPVDGCEPTICKRSGVTALAAGLTHTCVLMVGGYVRCWGNNTNAELGLGHAEFVADRHPYQLTDSSGAVAPIDLGGEATAIAAGNSHTCALLTDGSIRCWGLNDMGQLGLGHRNTPLDMTPRALGPISVGGKAIAIAAGGQNSCAILQGGTVRCWGINDNAQLGLGHVLQVSHTQLPSAYGPIDLGATATAVAIQYTNGCALLSDRTVRCWGANSHGQLGLGHKTPIGDDELPSAAGPVPMPAGRTAKGVAVGSQFACITLDDGSLECFGWNNYGQLGLGTALDIGDDESPADYGRLSTGGAVTGLAAGRAHSCAVIQGRGLVCWGNNVKAQLGYADTTTRGTTIETVPRLLPVIGFGGPTVASIASSGLHTCALLSNGQVRCWGQNQVGQLGLGIVNTTTPDYVGGDATHTPDQLASVRVLPP